ncbi:WxL domain-containing protein [Patescibacteria group bacterium]|nr:WxL domain-containing protein [Patescibacteria group bacterium]
MDKTILKKAENQVRQQLFGGLALLVAALMVANISGLVRAETDVTNITFNVNAGSFSIDNVPTAMTFPLMNFGESNSAHVAAPEMDGMAITDYRGNATAWSVAVTANNLVSGTDEISSAMISIANGDVQNIENLDTNYVAVGSNGTLDGAGTTLVNGSTQASGITGCDNAALTLNIEGTEAAGAYGAIVTYTLS